MDIESINDLDNAIAPGAYMQVYFVCRDGGVLCHDCVKDERKNIVDAICDSDIYADPQWDVIAYDVHWEGEPIICDHCGEQIVSEYGVPK